MNKMGAVVAVVVTMAIAMFGVGVVLRRPRGPSPTPLKEGMVRRTVSAIRSVHLIDH